MTSCIDVLPTSESGLCVRISGAMPGRCGSLIVDIYILLVDSSTLFTVLFQHTATLKSQCWILVRCKVRSLPCVADALARCRLPWAQRCWFLVRSNSLVTGI